MKSGRGKNEKRNTLKNRRCKKAGSIGEIWDVEYKHNLKNNSRNIMLCYCLVQNNLPVRAKNKIYLKLACTNVIRFFLFFVFASQGPSPAVSGAVI